ncbi:MAG TPA: transketolase [Candidatus Bathyarchaeia archaeon]|nr:transketolase [Candidatus Bathyarchaeia archaeon]
MIHIEKFLAHVAYKIRYYSIVMTSQAQSGHPTSCLSGADIVSVLFFYAMRYDPKEYENPNNDRFILSKGHAAPLLYAAWKEAGVISEKELMTYRHFGSALEGHPTRRFAYAEAATGSLGTGLSIGVGECIAARMNSLDYKVFVLLGDSEMSEGSIWEAVELAAYYKLDNLIGIIDANRLGQTTEVMFDHQVNTFEKVLHAHGWHTIVIDGHNISALMHACDTARAHKNQPTMIIAKTYKGHGVALAEDKEGFHGKAFVGAQEQEALTELKNFYPNDVHNSTNFVWITQLPEKKVPKLHTSFPLKVPPAPYSHTDVVPTRKAYGQALAALGSVCNTIVSLDAEVKNSTYAELFEEKFPDRFVQCFIAEQNMVSMGIGCERRGLIPFISTFACFFSRAHDQIRMAAIGQSPLRLCGSHAGVSIGQDGPSQMGLEDIAMMRCLPNSVVLYPCDATSTYKLVEQMVYYTDGISYLRTTRGATPVIYSAHDQFFIGGSRILRSSDRDQLCIVTAGITVFEALKAYEILKSENIFVAVIDAYSIKPLDSKTIIFIAQKAHKRILTVEDHYIQGGLGEAVCSAVQATGITVTICGITQLPTSGKPEELLAWAGIDAAGIVKMIKSIKK